METFKRFSIAVLAIVFVFGLTGLNTAQAATAPNLGVADDYSVFGNAGITETPARDSHLWGNAGGNGLGHVSLIASQVDGAIDVGANVPVVGAISSAYGDLAAEAQTAAIDLAASPTVVPGVYNVAATAFNSTLTLNGPGVYIFRSTSSIAQTAGGTMLLTNGACASDVFWQIPTSMTFAAAGDIEGTIITNTGLISFVSGVSLKGRAWAATQVTMNNNQITEPICTSDDDEEDADEDEGDEDDDVDIKVTKKADPETLSGSGMVTYTYKVTNEGDVALKDISVKDDKCSPVTYVSGRKNQNGKLDTDETWKYTCTKRVSATETNTVTAKGTASGDRVKDTDKATVAVSSSPGFPNAGIGPEDKNSIPWNIIIPMEILIALVSFCLARKKLAIQSQR